MKDNKLKSESIYIKSVIAVLFINFIHKFVREIPGSLKLIGGDSSVGGTYTIVSAIILALAIILLLARNRWGLTLGIIPGIIATFQWVVPHVIMGYPDQNGIWWYPIFPITMGGLIIYFTIVVWRNENGLE